MASLAPGRWKADFCLQTSEGIPEWCWSSENADEARSQAGKSMSGTRGTVWQQESDDSGVNALTGCGRANFLKNCVFEILEVKRVDSQTQWAQQRP